jgi:phosphate starvation-inducible PhoH-like protein
MKKTIELKGIELPILFGVADSHLKYIEERFPVTLLVRDEKLHIQGGKDEIDTVNELIIEMAQTAAGKGRLSKTDIDKLIEVILVDNGKKKSIPHDIVHYGLKGAITARTAGQTKYIQKVRKNDIVFSIGPAGTGKTYLAVAFAVAAITSHDVDRIVLCRPAVEAGESLGFLPGDLKEKVDPYLTPLYDALGEMVAAQRLKPLLSKHIIEVIPLAYMRGRTLNNAFLILDEAQNATALQMKMFLTRLGVNSKAIITGDITQIDLPKNTESGLIQVMNILREIDGIGFVELDETDVVRHHLVQKIIKAYDSS